MDTASRFRVAALILLAGCTADSFTSSDAASDGATSDASSDVGAEGSTTKDAALGDVGVSDVVIGFDAGTDAAPTSKIVFVSSATYTTNLGGLNGADSKCQTLANSAGLTGTFHAWLSDSTTAASTRLAHSTVPYVLTNGTMVASDWAGLTSGNLQNAIDVTEAKGTAPTTSTTCGTSAVWTGTNASGNPAGSYCNNWAGVSLDGGLSGVVGNTTANNDKWTDDCTSSCAGQAALYCIEQ